MLVALIALEYTCMAAFGERLLARAVQDKSPSWYLAQCFFLTMGGFIVKVDGESIWLPRIDLIKLFDTNVLSWPDKSLENDILDRSKADWVVMSLAFVQTIWFVTQVIGRAAQGLFLHHS
ncbi:hypothetical protein SVAN01_05069 [Stagonosporopsis vannaccii]|nr:hypothetical protein SVAN01_05069 [Stagonosporopsis vannaccii]